MSNHSTPADPTTCPVCSADTTERTATGDYTATYRTCPVCGWASDDTALAARERFDTIIRLGDVVDAMTSRAAYVPQGKEQAAFEVSYRADKARYSEALAELDDDELKEFAAYSRARK